ncbi:MFS transporter [Streptomyces sp. NPDC048278]|uniref:AMP-binding enzyme n=1 Tax=Streptomyces sp. NPDC048278 TaxID=3155809 RepID=UPI00344343DD
MAAASCAGTTIEFYDFFIYGTAAALVFPSVFFPALGGAAASVASFATFAVAFGARPLGAMIFGHFGDRLGRKKTLISTLLLMGVSTFLIGLLPTANAIGVAASVALVALRVAQGLSVGGEWAGATLFLYTHPDVLDAQVIGVPDEKYGEELMVWLRMRDGAEPLGAEAVREFCAGRLAHFKIPRYVHCAESFPTTVTGKIRKVEMREQAVEIVGLHS